MQAQAGKGEALATLMLEVAEGLSATPGCELYAINRAVEEVQALLAGPPERIDLQQLGGVGLAG